MRALAVIPARGGSKRVPGKNLRMLCGKPLIAWTIEAARASGVLFVVSTDCPDIAATAHSLGALITMRPASLAQDDTTTGEVLAFEAECWEKDFDAVVCLHPTSPIRDPAHISEAVAMLKASPLDYLASVVEVRSKTHPNVLTMKAGALLPAARERQVFVLNASIYAIKKEALLVLRRHVGFPCIPLVMDEAHSVDIDTEQDFAVAAAYLGGRQ